MTLLCDRTDRHQAVGNALGIGLEVPEVIDQSGVILHGRGLPSTDGSHIVFIADADVLHKLSPRFVCSASDRKKQLFRRGKSGTKAPAIEKLLIGCSIS